MGEDSLKVFMPMVIGALIGVGLCSGLDWGRKKEMRATAVELGCAAYNSQTGEWQWLDKSTVEARP